MGNRRPTKCAECDTLLKGKVQIIIPGLEPNTSSRLCVDCADKFMEGHLSEERRTHRDSPTFRGFISYTIKHYVRKSTSTKRKGAATKEDIVKGIKAGTLTVEEVLLALKESGDE